MKAVLLLLDALPELEAVSEYSFGGQFFKMVLTLGAFVVLLLALAWAYRKLGLKKTLFGNSYSQIQIIERRPLSQKSALYLIEVEGRRLIVGDSPAGMRTIADFTEPPAVEPAFEEILERKIQS